MTLSLSLSLSPFSPVPTYESISGQLEVGSCHPRSANRVPSLCRSFAPEHPSVTERPCPPRWAGKTDVKVFVQKVDRGQNCLKINQHKKDTEIYQTVK